MKRSGFTPLICGGYLMLAVNVLAGAEDRPNLLIIQTDEHNFRTLGCYRDTLPPEQALMWGKAVVETPNLDRLAREGALCTGFYATSPVCSPSRSSFVSGKYPQNTPVVTNNVRMDDEVITFAEILRRRGYVTGYAGKWHLDGNDKPGWEPLRKFGFEDNRYMFNRGHWKLLELEKGEPKVGTKQGKPSYAEIGDEKTFSTDWLCDRTIEFIEKHKSEPFCYMCAIPDPHGPDSVRAPYDSMYEDQVYKKPRSAEKSPQGLPSWAQMNNKKYDQSQYYGMIKCIDDNVGRILSYLERNKLLDKTIVVFTADHGDLRGEHGRQNKGVPFEGSARIPFLIRWPEKIKPGTQVHQALDCTDFLPTILGLMKVPTLGTEEGRDASALFTGAVPADWNDMAFMRAAGRSNKGWVAAVTQRFKLVYCEKDDPWLFDLKKDPDELVNEYRNPEYQSVIRKLAKGLKKYGERCDDPYLEQPNVVAEIARMSD